MTLATATGPIERTVLELSHINRSAAFRSRHNAPARDALRNSDALMALIEDAHAEAADRVPPWLWTAVARVVASVDSELRDELGIDRRPTHVADILFRAQEYLMLDAHDEAQPVLAPIIQLFA